MIEGERALELNTELTLLGSKTRIPWARQDAVDRSRLTSLLGRTPLSVVVAPAGWGKTTLLAQWARHARKSHPVAWITLDATDNEPNRFWTYLTTSLQQAGSKVGESALAALKVARLDPIEVAIPRLLNDLSATGQRHSLVLDDYHLIGDRHIREAVEYFIAYLPANARVIVGSRFDPPLPLALWRGRGIVTEVRAEHLRFDSDEVYELFESTMGGDLPTDELLAWTEGWAAGLQLVRMGVRGARDPVGEAAAMRGDGRHLIDYVTSEVLGALNDSQRDFMVRASVLEQLFAPLCDYALGIQGSARLLRELEQVDPFITRLHEQGGWYRWHPIVREALRRELDQAGDDQRIAVLRGAAEWHLQQGDIEQAVRLFSSAGDTESAVRLLLRHEDEFLDAGEIGTFLALAQTLGPHSIDAAPLLGLSMAWAAFLSARTEMIGGLLDRTRSALVGDEPPPRGWNSILGSIAALRALGGYESGLQLDTARAWGEKAISEETDPALPGFSVARFALGVVLMAQARIDEALPHLEEPGVDLTRSACRSSRGCP